MPLIFTCSYLFTRLEIWVFNNKIIHLKLVSTNSLTIIDVINYYYFYYYYFVIRKKSLSGSNVYSVGKIRCVSNVLDINNTPNNLFNGDKKGPTSKKLASPKDSIVIKTSTPSLSNQHKIGKIGPAQLPVPVQNISLSGNNTDLTISFMDKILKKWYLMK